MRVELKAGKMVSWMVVHSADSKVDMTVAWMELRKAVQRVDS